MIYGAKDRFRIHRKKRFTGHLVAGYACQVNFSPDGRFIMSGDSEGSIWFWVCVFLLYVIYFEMLF